MNHDLTPDVVFITITLPVSETLIFLGICLLKIMGKIKNKNKNHGECIIPLILSSGKSMVGKNHSGCLWEGWGRDLTGKGHEGTFWGDGSNLYHDMGLGYTCTHLYKLRGLAINICGLQSWKFFNKKY